ncbi:glycosyltransferase family 4 protein [Candidatus Micrarchaeota archaeon]|nr:glycosyltransferase family 4 protein [Candidatus Micrarchaeota archaeon]
MEGPVFRNLRIAANTSSSTEAFARRTNELSRFISGIGRQCCELERCIGGRRSLHLIKAHPELRERSREGNVRRFTLPLLETIGTTNPNNIYRKARTLDELQDAFAPLIAEMARIIQSVDVVLLGGTYFVPWCLLQAARQQRKPVVLCYAGILSMEIRHLPEEMQGTLKLMEKDFYDPRIFYIFPSELTRRTVQQIFGNTLQKSEVVYNGVPPEFLAYSENPEKEVPIAFVGRNTSVKNPEFLLGLAGALRSKGSTHRIHMVTSADPNNSLIRELRKAGVIILEPMDTGRLADFYRSASVIVSPSKFETYGNVPLESVSTGTPALISPGMGVGEVFRMLGIGGYITAFDDPLQVAERADSIIRTNESVPNEVRERIRKDLSWNQAILRYLEICEVQAKAA